MGIVLQRDPAVSPAAETAAALPRLTVLVAAKDEEANIEACVGSLIRQEYPSLRVVAVNDRSTDRTGEILDRLAAAHGDRLDVLHVHELPDGWFGKCHALHLGMARAEGEWLLFTDADCRFHSPQAIATGVAEAQRRGLDLFSLTPALIIENDWEHVVQPVCAAILILWFKPKRVNDPQRPDAYANGAFILMSRACYDAIGGHERVRDQTCEDIALARIAKASGRRIGVARNDGIYGTRMYTTLREAWRGWSRIYVGALRTPVRVAIAIGFLSVFTLTPWLSLMAAAVGWWQADPAPLVAAAEAPVAVPSEAASAHIAQSPSSWAPLVIVWAVACAAQLWSVSRWYELTGSRRRWCVAYPVGGVFALGVLFDSLLKSLGWRQTVWRGSRYAHRITP